MNEVVVVVVVITTKGLTYIISTERRGLKVVMRMHLYLINIKRRRRRRRRYRIIQSLLTWTERRGR